MAVEVASVYDFRGPVIKVGKYSKNLKSQKLEVILRTASQMEQDLNTLTPAQMFVLAIRLYDLGIRDGAVIWYYRARYRSRLFFKTLQNPGEMYGPGKPTAAAKLWASYTSFSKQVGLHITGYAGCNIDNWVMTIRKVEQTSRRVPDLPTLFSNVEFKAKKDWINANIEVSAEMQRLWQSIASRREKIKRKRATRNMDARYCNQNAS